MVCFYGFQCNSSAVCESLKGFFCDLQTAWRLVLSMKPWSYIWLEFGLFSTIIYIYTYSPSNKHQWGIAEPNFVEGYFNSMLKIVIHGHHAPTTMGYFAGSLSQIYNVASGPIVLFTCNVLAMSILVPLSTVNISTTSNCQCLIVHVAVVFCRFQSTLYEPSCNC